jgi:hypothetical protein
MLTEPNHRQAREGYERLVDRLRTLIERSIPAGTSSLVVSRGDGRMLDVAERQVGHFPQTSTGLYAGHHPADGHAAVSELERLWAVGARYLVIPDTGRWWLEHYGELRNWLETRGGVVADEPETGIVFRLERADDRAADAATPAESARVAAHVGALIDALLPPEAGVALVTADTAPVPVEGRQTWAVPAPGADSGLNVDVVLARIEDRRRAGAAYLAVVNPAEPSLAIDARLSQQLAMRFRCVCRRRLIEVFDLAPGEAHG